MSLPIYRSTNSAALDQSYRDESWRKEVAALPIRFTEKQPGSVKPGFRLEERQADIYRILVPVRRGYVPKIFTVRFEQFLGQRRCFLDRDDGFGPDALQIRNGKAVFKAGASEYELDVRARELSVDGRPQPIDHLSQTTEYAQVPDFMFPWQAAEQVKKTESAEAAAREKAVREKRAREHQAVVDRAYHSQANLPGMRKMLENGASNRDLYEHASRIGFAESDLDSYLMATRWEKSPREVATDEFRRFVWEHGPLVNQPSIADREASIMAHRHASLERDKAAVARETGGWRKPGGESFNRAVIDRGDFEIRETGSARDPGPPPPGYGRTAAYDFVDSASAISGAQPVSGPDKAAASVRVSVARIPEKWNVPSTRPPLLLREDGEKMWLGFARDAGTVDWIPPNTESQKWEWMLDGTTYELDPKTPEALSIRGSTSYGVKLDFRPQSGFTASEPDHDGLDAPDPAPPSEPKPRRGRPTEVTTGSPWLDRHLDRLLLAARASKADGRWSFPWARHIPSGQISQYDFSRLLNALDRTGEGPFEARYGQIMYRGPR